MSITDELRVWAHGLNTYNRNELQVLAIADRIDAAHEKTIASVMNDALYHANDEDMAALGWVRLPKDADGEYIHVGDVMEWVDEPCDHFTVNGIGDNTLFYFDEDTDSLEWTNAERKRHHKQPTVEDVLRDMHAKLNEVIALYVGEAIDSDERDSDEARIFAKYAAKLREMLAGDAE